MQQQQEAPFCRFCLDTKQTGTNPLLEPCGCRGSMRYVHKKCLTRWRRQDPFRNATTCLLCMTPYGFLENDVIEDIPDDSGLLGLALRMPLFLSVGVNYIFVVHLTMVPYRTVDNRLFELYQYFFQGLYCLFFALSWSVKQKRLYLERWRTKEVVCFLILHAWANYCIAQHRFFAVLPLNVVMTFYWNNHKRVLGELNVRY